jgi:hypothetical protein
MSESELKFFQEHYNELVDLLISGFFPVGESRSMSHQFWRDKVRQRLIELGYGERLLFYDSIITERQNQPHSRP